MNEALVEWLRSIRQVVHETGGGERLAFRSDGVVRSLPKLVRAFEQCEADGVRIET